MFRAMGCRELPRRDDDLMFITDASASLAPRFNLDIERQPLSLVALGGDVDFWSVAIYDRDANEVFSMNDRTSVAGDVPY